MCDEPVKIGARFSTELFDDVFVHSRTMDGKTDVEVHITHVRKVLKLMRKHKLYANLTTCNFAASEIPLLGCIVGKHGVRPDPEKIKASTDWPVPADFKGLRNFLGLAAYLHKYSRNYAGITVHLSHLLKKNEKLSWNADCQRSFEGIKESLMQSPILQIADQDRPFHVICDASDFSIGCALMQYDTEGAERVICYQSRQLQAAERNYPVHEKELLAMKYTLAKFRVYLLGDRLFIVYTDHPSLRTAVNSPHLSQQMARWLSFFAEYNFSVEFKPGRLNVVADALSRRPDFEPGTQPYSEGHLTIATLTASVPSSTLLDDVQKIYAEDKDLLRLMDHLVDPSRKSHKDLTSLYRFSVGRYTTRNGLLYYTAVASDTPCVVVPDHYDLRLRILYECHDAPTDGHRGRENTYLPVSRDFYWRRQYQYVRKSICACEVCQRVKPSPSSCAPLQRLPVPAECYQSISLDFVFGFPEDAHKITGILLFVDRFSKMVHLAAVPESITAQDCARVFIDTVFRFHGLPRELVSDHDPRFTAEFWRSVIRSLRTRLKISTYEDPETDGQTEHSNRVFEQIRRGYVHSFSSWSEFLPMVEFAIKNSVLASTQHTPFFVNGLRHPRLPTFFECDSWRRGGDRSSKHRSGSCSSCAEANVVTYDCDVDQIDVEDDHLHNNNEFIIESDDDDDARIFSIANDYSSEDEDTLDDKQKEERILSTVRTRRTEQTKVSSAEGFLLAREAVVRSVQDSIAYAVDRQERNADKNGRANVYSFIERDLVLLSTVNLPRPVVTSVGSSELLPEYIGPFRVLRRQGNAYTIELPRRMHTHPTFYVGRLHPYCQYETSSDDEDSLHVQESPSDSCVRTPDYPSGCVLKRPPHSNERSLCEQPPARQQGSGQSAQPGVAKRHTRPDLSPDQTHNIVVLPHKIGQSVASAPLVFQVLAQLNDCAVRLVGVGMVSRMT